MAVFLKGLFRAKDDVNDGISRKNRIFGVRKKAKANILNIPNGLNCVGKGLRQDVGHAVCRDSDSGLRVGLLIVKSTDIKE